jgi:hypothetical protein
VLREADSGRASQGDGEGDTRTRELNSAV